MENLVAKKIEKEEVESLVFPSNPISLRSNEEQKAFVTKLKNAEKLGNLFHNKIEIIFQDEEGLKEVNTTIWAVGEDHILLKKGVFIPVNRIVSIIL
ncbi:MAG: hypothetical protein ABF258_08940 [Flavobacteriales bacterium]